MKLELNEARIEYFENNMELLAPWMHSYKFGENIYTGYYKYEGLGCDLTYVNSKSRPEDIKKMSSAYLKTDESKWQDFIKKVMDNIPAQERATMSLLDISSATGKLCITAVNNGFGKLISSEIRKKQCEQQNLIYECLDDGQYQRKINVIHDMISADAEDFPTRYISMDIDCVASFGLLYHLANPVQHIVNLHTITNKYAILYTLTHHNPFARRFWALTMEDSGWITKATSSLSWTPHFHEVERICKNVGFRKVKILYPDIFETNFPCYNKDSMIEDSKMILHKAMRKIFGIRVGMEKNLDFNYFKYTSLNPLYFAYFLVK